MIHLGSITFATTSTAPTTRRLCGYLNTGTWQPVTIPMPDPGQDDKPDICTQEEWDNFVQEMGMEKEPEYVYTNSTFTAASVSGAAW